MANQRIEAWSSYLKRNRMRTLKPEAINSLGTENVKNIDSKAVPLKVMKLSNVKLQNEIIPKNKNIEKLNHNNTKSNTFL